MIGIIELLKNRGLNLTPDVNIKYVRHQDQRYDIKKMIKEGFFEVYQSYQNKPIFNECDYIIVFLGLDNGKAVFHGVYRVCGKKLAKDVAPPVGFPCNEYADLVSGEYYYDLERESGFEDLIDRAVIDWGNSALSWHQWLKRKSGTLCDKEIVEIYPKGKSVQFPGYLDFTIEYEELKKIINHPASNREWHIMLAGVAGVYLILDTKGGQQYVGSAYGKDGILGRWKQYAKDGHGGNELLKKLIAENQDASKHFKFTILRTLPKTLTNKEVIGFENIYKSKLGSRAFGLNLLEGQKSSKMASSEIAGCPFEEFSHLELNKILEDHTPLAIFPDGLKKQEGGWVHARVVAEGFIVPGGFFFFDDGWNYPLGGTGMDHFVRGTIEGPFPPIEELRGHARYWIIKDKKSKLDVYLFELVGNETMRNGVNLYAPALHNKERAERLENEEYGSRKKARELVKQFMAN